MQTFHCDNQHSTNRSLLFVTHLVVKLNKTLNLVGTELWMITSSIPGSYFLNFCLKVELHFG